MVMGELWQVVVGDRMVGTFSAGASTRRMSLGLALRQELAEMVIEYTHP